MSHAIGLPPSWIADPSIVMDAVRVLGVTLARKESDGRRYRVTVEHSIDGATQDVADITATVSGTVMCCIGTDPLGYVARYIEWCASTRENDGGKLRWLQATQPIIVRRPV